MSGHRGAGTSRGESSRRGRALWGPAALWLLVWGAAACSGPDTAVQTVDAGSSDSTDDASDVDASATLETGPDAGPDSTGGQDAPLGDIRPDADPADVLRDTLPEDAAADRDTDTVDAPQEPALTVEAEGDCTVTLRWAAVPGVASWVVMADRQTIARLEAGQTEWRHAAPPGRFTTPVASLFARSEPQGVRLAWLPPSGSPGPEVTYLVEAKGADGRVLSVERARASLPVPVATHYRLRELGGAEVVVQETNHLDAGAPVAPLSWEAPTAALVDDGLYEVRAGAWTRGDAPLRSWEVVAEGACATSPPSRVAERRSAGTLVWGWERSGDGGGTWEPASNEDPDGSGGTSAEPSPLRVNAPAPGASVRVRLRATDETGLDATSDAATIAGPAWAIGTTGAPCDADADCSSGLVCTVRPARPVGWVLPLPSQGAVAPRFCAPSGEQFIPAGTYPRGALHLGEASLVTLSRGFLIGETEVTQQEWDETWQTLGASRANPSWFRPGGPAGELACPNRACPVESLNWYDALQFANARTAAHNVTHPDEPLVPCYLLSACEGLPLDSGCGEDICCVSPLAEGEPLYSEPGTDPGVVLCSAVENPFCADVRFLYTTCTGYRLPTEAEWEIAARCGVGDGEVRHRTRYVCGNDPSCLVDLVIPGSDYFGGRTRAVRSLAPNDCGLHDLASNVWEWVWDSDGWSSWPTPVIDPLGTGAGRYRGFRGSQWGANLVGAELGARGYLQHRYRGRYLGLRLARTVFLPDR